MNNSDKIILDLCGGTGAWSKPYADAGYDVRNITLPEYDLRYTGFFKECMVFRQKKLNNTKRLLIECSNVYGILAAPPCEQFSFVRTTPKVPRDLKEGMCLVIACLRIIWECQYNYKNQHQKLSPLKFWVIENPFFGSLKWFLGKPYFVFQPYEFGDGYKKKTALWGQFNEPIKLDKWILKTNKKFDRLLIDEIKQLKSPVNDEMGNPKTRKELRAITPSGFAQAFFEANQ